MLRKFAAIAAFLFAAEAQEQTDVEIAPGVRMPYVNCGGVTSKPSNYSAFLDFGGVGLDTALTYGEPTQTSVGEAVKASGLPREKLFITTKVPCCPQAMVGKMCAGNYSGSIAANVKTDIDQLGVEYVDLMLLHWGCENLDDTIARYKDLEKIVMKNGDKSTGVARAIGVSNFNSTTMEALLSSGITVKPAINQCGYSIGAHIADARGLGRDDATRVFCQKHGIAYEAYSPLGGLSGVDVLGNQVVKSIAAAHNTSAAQIALRWIVQQGALFVTAAANPEYLKEDLGVFNFALTDKEMADLSAVGVL